MEARLAAGIAMITMTDEGVMAQVETVAQAIEAGLLTGTPDAFGIAPSVVDDLGADGRLQAAVDLLTAPFVGLRQPHERGGPDTFRDERIELETVLHRTRKSCGAALAAEEMDLLRWGWLKESSHQVRRTTRSYTAITWMGEPRLAQLRPAPWLAQYCAREAVAPADVLATPARLSGDAAFQASHQGWAWASLDQARLIVLDRRKERGREALIGRSIQPWIDQATHQLVVGEPQPGHGQPRVVGFSATHRPKSSRQAAVAREAVETFRTTIAMMAALEESARVKSRLLDASGVVWPTPWLGFVREDEVQLTLAGMTPAFRAAAKAVLDGPCYLGRGDMLVCQAVAYAKEGSGNTAQADTALDEGGPLTWLSALAEDDADMVVGAVQASLTVKVDGLYWLPLDFFAPPAAGQASVVARAKRASLAFPLAALGREVPTVGQYSIDRLKASVQVGLRSGLPYVQSDRDPNRTAVRYDLAAGTEEAQRPNRGDQRRG